MLGPFEFQEGGRTYRCAVEESPVARGQGWWWFSVSNDNSRYAPFPATAGDTRKSVKERVVGYYENHLARRAAPPPQRAHWAQKQKQKQADQAKAAEGAKASAPASVAAAT